MKIAKKAESTVAKFLVSIILFIIVFIAISMGASTLWKLYITKPKMVTENSLNLLVKHVKYLDTSISDSFPLQVDKKHVIRGYDKDDSAKPNFAECKTVSCICILTSSENTVVKCETAESSTDKEARLREDFVVNAEEGVKNFYLEKDATTKKISINIA